MYAWPLSFVFLYASCVCRIVGPFASVGASGELNLQNEVRNDTRETQAADDTEAHEILWRINIREQVRPVDLRQITHRVNNSQANTPDLLIHRAKCRRSIRQRQRIRRPQSASHDNEQRVPRVEVVHGAGDDTADHGDGHPHRQGEAAVLRDAVHEDGVEEGADKGGDVDRHRHVLRHGARVAEALDQRRVEVGQGRGADDGHVADDEDPGAPVDDGALQGCHVAELFLFVLVVRAGVLHALDC